MRMQKLVVKKGVWGLTGLGTTVLKLRSGTWADPLYSKDTC